jgi:hypothetical protein
MNKQLNPRQIKTIQNFWNWFQDNEQAIYHACKLEINKEEVLFHIQRNLNYISKRIEIIIYEVPNQVNKLHIMISALGYKKLFPKVIALGDAAPKLEHFTIHTFIKPITSDNQHILPSVISTAMQQIFIKLEDYNTATKKVVLIIYAPVSLEKFNLSFLLYFTLGEVNYKKHIKEVYYRPLPKSTNGLLLLSELPEYIDFLAKINYNRKLKIFLE